MKHFLATLGLPLVASSVAILGAVDSSSAQNIPSRYTRPTAGNLIAQGTTTDAITPEAALDSELPAQYGIVRSMSGNTVEVRTLDGTYKSYPLSSEALASTGSLQRGDLVGFDVDEAGTLTNIAPPEIDQNFEGTVSSIDGDQVTVLSSTGESLTTTVRPSTMARLGLQPGREVTVTQYRGTWATKICCVEAPPPVTSVPVAPIQPTPPAPTGGGFQPEPAVVPGLW